MIISTDAGQIEFQYTLAQGGQGAAIKAFNWTRGTWHAAKVVKPPLYKYLFQELTIAQALDHPHIIKPELTVTEDGEHILLTPLCDGSISDIKRDTWTIQNLKRISLQLCSALGYMQHPSRLIMHRDIKPGNILILKGDAFLNDFGFACSLLDGERKDLVGTPPYLSIQALNGITDLSNDVYSLAVTIYWVITNRHPLWIDTQNLAYPKMYNAYATLHRTHAPLAMNLPRGFQKLEKTLQKAISKDVAQRYRSAAEFGIALWDAFEALKREGYSLSTPLTMVTNQYPVNETPIEEIKTVVA